MANTENTFGCSLTAGAGFFALGQQLRPTRQQEESWQELQTTFTKGLLRFHKELSGSQQVLHYPSALQELWALSVLAWNVRLRSGWDAKAWHSSTARITRCIDWVSRLINVLWNAWWQCWMLILSRENLIFSRWKHWFQPGWDLPCIVPNMSII